MLLWILAGASIAGGFVTLWNGGTTVPASLLVIGYCVLVPLAIIRRREPADAKQVAHAPYGEAVIAALAVFALYVFSLAPSTAMWDTSEYMAASKVLGLPHPPGNPVFMLLAHVAGALPIARDYAVRMNLLAAFASASAAGLWYLIAYGTLERMFTARWMRSAGAAVAVIFGATAFTVWNQSVVNEKVYTVSLAQLALVAWLAILWSRRKQSAGSDRLLLLSAYLIALGYGVHPAGFLAGPAIAMALLVSRPRTLLRPRVLIGGAALGLLGLTPFAYEPIRSAHDPAINEGEPTLCDGHIGFACTFNSVTLERLRSNVERLQYAKPSVLERQAPFSAQMGMWWLYWKWQWFRDARHTAPPLQLFLALGALALAAIGARAQWRHDRAAFTVMGTLVATVTVLLIYYLNFKYGFSESPELGESVAREVRDRDYFFIWSFSALGVWVGLGLAAVWNAMAVRFAVPASRAAPILLLAAVPFFMNRHDAPRSGQLFTREWARDVLESAEPGAIVLTAGDNDTFPLWYAQEVEGVRRDVTVVISGYLALDWAPWQLARRRPDRFDPAASPAIWRDVRIPEPRPALSESREQLDAVPMFTEFKSAQQFVHGAMRVTIPPGTVTRDQILMLQMIRDSFPDRPVMFTNPQFPTSVGLERYLVRAGLLWQLTPDEVQLGNGVVAAEGGPMNLERTRRLWREVYRGVQQLDREGGWVDAASLSIPAQYYFTGNSLAGALDRAGVHDEALAVKRDVDGVLRLLSGVNRTP